MLSITITDFDLLRIDSWLGDRYLYLLCRQRLIIHSAWHVIVQKFLFSLVNPLSHGFWFPCICIVQSHNCCEDLHKSCWSCYCHFCWSCAINISWLMQVSSCYLPSHVEEFLTWKQVIVIHPRVRVKPKKFIYMTILRFAYMKFYLYFEILSWSLYSNIDTQRMFYSLQCQ